MPMVALGTMVGSHLAKQTTYLNLPGTAGNDASTADNNVLDVTGDLEIWVKCSAATWNTGTAYAFVSKFFTTGNQRSYFAGIDGSGFPFLTASVDGSATLQWTASVAVQSVVSGGDKILLKWQLDVDNGASGNTMTPYYSTDNGGTFTALGVAQTKSGTTAIFNSTSEMHIGALQGGAAASPFPGKIYYVRVVNGINGTRVVDLDLHHGPIGASSVIDVASGLTFTINGTAALMAA